MKIAAFIVIFIGALITLLGAYFKWDWMFKTRKSKAYVEGTHFEQDQIFYGVIGIVLFIIALIVILVPQVSQTLAGKLDVMTIIKVEDDGSRLRALKWLERSRWSISYGS
jgi:hypothetical protein